MNPLTQIKQTQLINQKEAALGIGEDASWHAKFKDSAYVFVGGVPFDLTEGDLLAVFAQYGEVVDMNLVRDKATGKSRGFAFVAYEDQRSTTLAVDNLNGAKVLGRTIRVEHVGNYKKKEEEDEEEEQKKREERGVCYAFQKGECNRGASCRYSHDEQRNANTGWGSKEDSNPRWEHDRHRDPSKKGETRGVCYAFQKGECDRGTSCRFSHDEQVAVQARGVCYAFRKGECNRGASCRFSHDQQRNANNGWGSKEDNNTRREHHRDLDPPKSHKNFPSSATDQRFPDRSKEDSRSVDRGGHSSRSEVYRDRDSRMGHGDRNTKDKDRHRHDRSPERSRSERHRSDDRYMHGRGERSEKYKSEDKHDEGDRKRSRHDRDSTGRYERRGDEEAEERNGKSRR